MINKKDFEAYINSEEFKEHAKEQLKKEKEKENRLYDLIYTDEYKDWIINVVSSHNDIIWDDNLLYDESIDKEYIDALFYFIDLVDAYAYRQRVRNGADYNTMSLNSTLYDYVIKIKNNFYNISKITGQGTCCCIKKCAKPCYHYVDMNVEYEV